MARTIISFLILTSVLFCAPGTLEDKAALLDSRARYEVEKDNKAYVERNLKYIIHQRNEEIQRKQFEIWIYQGIILYLMVIVI